MTEEPYVTEEIRTGKARLLLDMFDGYPSPPLESVFFTTRDFARKHPEAVARFANVVQDAAKYTNAHAVETLPLFIQLSGMNPHRKSDPPFAHAGLVQRSLTQPVIELAAKYRTIPPASMRASCWLSS